jgi:hypothetical protein
VLAATGVLILLTGGFSALSSGWDEQAQTDESFAPAPGTPAANTMAANVAAPVTVPTTAASGATVTNYDGKIYHAQGIRTFDTCARMANPALGTKLGAAGCAAPLQAVYTSGDERMIFTVTLARLQSRQQADTLAAAIDNSTNFTHLQGEPLVFAPLLPPAGKPGAGTKPGRSAHSSGLAGADLISVEAWWADGRNASDEDLYATGELWRSALKLRMGLQDLAVRTLSDQPAPSPNPTS